MELPAVQEATDRIHIPRPTPGAGLHLICCPHAGASAKVFGPLARALPPDIEALSVQYPGRQGTPDYQGFSGISELATLVCESLRPWWDRPLAVYGHSMGSVVAFEVTRRLRQAGAAPLRLFVSGRRSPSDGLGVRVPRNDEEIIEELKTLGAVPTRLLDRPKYRDSILTVIRNDYRANSRYVATSNATVDCPVTFLLSDADPYVDDRAARGWEGHSTGGFSLVPFHGGHFFLNDQLTQVVATMTGQLRTDALQRDSGGRR